MSNPFTFDTVSPRFGLPFLFVGQAQKEDFVNEAHALADALLHCAVEGELSSPPTTPTNGQSWIVGTAPDGDWTDHEGELACSQAGNWLFVIPQNGMRAFDRSTGQAVLYDNGWQRPAAPSAPSGGSTIDAEARSALANLIAALRASGIFPNT